MIWVVVAAMAAAPFAIGKSAKRGVCWDEDVVKLNEHHASLLSPGVSWVYNWGPDGANTDVYDAGFRFEPMAWNGAYNAKRLRAWLTSHPESEYLLAFNEPNFSDQARMTPQDAAKAWPELKALAAEFGLKLVAPALNFSNSQVGGRVWTPYEWYDEFFRLVPDAGCDCLAMHCYMNWYSANTWLATEYFYANLYNPKKDCYGRYPNLVAYLDTFKDEHGHFPRMMLTEFCSWENDGTITGVDFQIDQMTQKIQKLEQSDLVEGYAWFMANPGSGASAYPYMSLLQTNSATSALSALGKVYVHMSDFDAERYFTVDEAIAASDYIDATTDDRVVKVRPNTDVASAQPLQIEIPAAGYPDYQIDVTADGDYRFTVRLKADAATRLTLYCDMKKSTAADVAGDGTWQELSFTAPLTAGRHRIMLYNAGSEPVFVNELRFDAADGVDRLHVTDVCVEAIYTLQGVKMSAADFAGLAPGVYVVRRTDGSSIKITK